MKTSIIIQMISRVKSVTFDYGLLNYAIVTTRSLGEDIIENVNAYFTDMLYIWYNVITDHYLLAATSDLPSWIMIEWTKIVWQEYQNNFCI